MENWLAEGTRALVSGLGTVFIVLILISLIISLFKYIKPAQPKTKEVKPAETKKVEVKKEDDLELVAVITAAIAASLNTTTDKLQVRSIRRVNSRPRWNRY